MVTRFHISESFNQLKNLSRGKLSVLLPLKAEGLKRVGCGGGVLLTGHGGLTFSKPYGETQAVEDNATPDLWKIL
jgi:hypothetical protein